MQGRARKRTPEQVELERVRRRNQRLEAELARTRAAFEIVGKSTRALGAALRERGLRAAVEQVIEPAFAELAPLIHTKQACVLLGKPCAPHYRRRRPRPSAPTRPRPSPPNALSSTERQQILDMLHERRLCDLAPAQVWARLLDEGVYLASISTMYRLLRVQGESRDRRRQRTHPARVKPQLVATRPNDVWSWISPNSLDPTATASSTCT